MIKYFFYLQTKSHLQRNHLLKNKKLRRKIPLRTSD